MRYQIPSVHAGLASVSRAVAPADGASFGAAHALPAPVSLHVETMPYPGLDHVLSEAQRLIRLWTGDPRIRMLALHIASAIPRRAETGHPDYRAYPEIARAVYAWMLANIVYVRDPAGIEQLQAPDVTLQLGAGDCEDMVVLAAVLLGSLGVPCRLLVVRQQGSPEFNHILLQFSPSDAGAEWINFDVTTARGIGTPLPASVVEERTVQLSGLSGLGAELAPIIFVPDLIRISLLELIQPNATVGAPMRLKLEIETWRVPGWNPLYWSLDCPHPIIVARGASSGRILGWVRTPEGGAGCTVQTTLALPGFNPASELVVIEGYRDTWSIEDIQSGKATPKVTSDALSLRDPGVYTDPSGSTSYLPGLPDKDDLKALTDFLKIAGPLALVGAGVYFFLPVLGAARGRVAQRAARGEVVAEETP